MKIIICGAGQVGRGIAERLAAEDNDVTVVDTSEVLVREVRDTLDVDGYVGHGSHPDVLDAAGASETDMIIAVTHTDEVNMMACEVANAIFNIPTKIARVRHQSYLRGEYRTLFSRDNTAIDVVISPEIAVGDLILRRLELPGAFETIYFVDEKVVALGIALREDCPVINTPLSQLSGLFPDLNATVVAVSRDGEMHTPHGVDQMLPGDRIYVVADQAQANRVLVLFGRDEKPAQRVLIAGGGNIGTYVAAKLEGREGTRTRVSVIEADRQRAEDISEQLSRTVVLHGNALDETILREATIQRVEAFLAVTNDDKVNVLAAMLAKHEGALQAMSLVSSIDIQPLAEALAIDSHIDPRSVTVASILQHVRRGRIRGVHPIEAGAGELIEAEALDTSPMIGKPLREAELPDGVRIGAIVRNDKVIIPTGSTEVRPNDQVVIFALRDRVEDIQHLVRVSPQYF